MKDKANSVQSECVVSSHVRRVVMPPSRRRKIGFAALSNARPHHAQNLRGTRVGMQMECRNIVSENL